MRNHGYISSIEAAVILGVSKRTLSRWVKLRKGPASIKVGRSVYYRRAAVDQWLLDLEDAGATGCTR